MAAWNYIVVGLCLLLLIFLLWKEISRFNKANLIWRITASTISTIALACLAFTFNTTSKINNQNKNAILLTEGFNKDSVALYNINKLPIYSLINYPTTYNFDTLHVFGYGLTETELNKTNAAHLIFHPTERVEGINSADWQHQLNAHELFMIQGNFNNSFPTPIKLILKAYNNGVDSIVIAPNSRTNFNLKTMPQHIGKALFNLIVINNKDTIEQEPIPMEVLPANKLNVLVLASSPDFENKFLSNWLAENGFTVALRTTISKNKFKQSFLDTSKFSLNRISTEVLNKFDVLVCDATELATISLPELNTIKNQIIQNGLGLIIRADSNIATGFYHSYFPIKSINGNHDPLSVHIADSNYNLINEHPSFIQQQTGTQPLIADQLNRILVSSSLYGAGKLVFATPDNTYSWLLANNLPAYQNYWSLLLQQAAHKTVHPNDFFTDRSFPFINQTINLFTSSQNTVARINVNGSVVSPQQNAFLPFMWSGTFWPTFSGWQATVLNDGIINWWFANNTNDWKTITNQQKLLTTNQFISHQKNNPQLLNNTNTIEIKPFPKIYFFIIFFLSCIFLWLEKKLM